MSLRVVGTPDGPGPIDAEARALLERILARKKLLAIGITWESADDAGFEVIPPLESTRLGLAQMTGEMVRVVIEEEA